MKKGVVSVIIPVYNAERTVEACVESVLAQSWPGLEIIAVDDGSRDGSLGLLRRLAEEDARLRVFSQPNGGVASARNLGIRQATGQYLQFVDSDDLLLPGATQRMVQAMERGDRQLVIAPYIEAAGDFHHIRGKRGYIRENRSLTQREFLEGMTQHPNSFYYAVLWNKLYLRELVGAHQIECDSRFFWGEDFDFNTRYYRYAKNVEALAEPVYTYNRRAGGLALNSVRQCARHPWRSARMKWQLQQSYERLFRDTGLYDEYRRVLKRYLFGVTISG